MGLFKSIRAWVSSLTNSDGKAVHMESEDGCHTIALDSIKVVIVQDGPSTWHAQSLDIDYAASGLSLEEVQRNFERGLLATMRVHLKHFGSIERLMKSPHAEDVAAVGAGEGYKFSMLAKHAIKDEQLSARIPFHSICYQLGAKAA